MWRSIRDGSVHLVTRRPRRWRPLLAVYYLTYACDLRCPYCSDGAQNPYWALRAKTLPADDVLRLLAIVRRTSDFLVLTGGEPLLHPQVEGVLAGLPALRFDDVVLTTNGRDLPRLLPVVSRSVGRLVVSLDTLDAEKADRWFGAGEGVLAQVLESLEAARAFPGRRYELIVSAVATPDNLEDLHAVYDFCRERRIRFAVCPQLEGVTPHPALRENAAYRALYERLVRQKRRGHPVYGSVSYLKSMRDLRSFRCRPSTMLTVTPTGDVLYPCLEIGHVAGNLLETPDLQAIGREGRERFGPPPDCRDRCHSACALGFAVAFGRPLSNVYEGLLRGLGAVTGRSSR